MSSTTQCELLYGKGSHVDPIVCLEDVSFSIAAGKIAGYPHSIWQIVEHMNYWMDYEIHRITAQPLAYPDHAIQSWPGIDGPAGEAEWDATRASFLSLLGKLEALSNSGPQILQRPVASDRSMTTAHSVEAVLWQMVAHNSYHLGQIAMIRRCLGAWPPRRGGDSW